MTVRPGPLLAHPEGSSAGCPKHMVYGPCGGVDPSGGCEVDHRPCPFVTSPGPDWAGSTPVQPARPRTPAAYELTRLGRHRPLIVAEVPTASVEVCHQRQVASTLAGGCDAGITGDAPWARVQLPPTLRAELLADEGLRAWVGLTCRDRNRVALESELLGLRAVGAAAVHCVTGDHPAVGDRPDGPGVFDLDSTRLAALAAGSGMVVSVTEAPACPPVDGRAARLATKVAAGATWCVLGFTADLAQLQGFIDAVGAQATGVQLVVSIPVVTNHDALRLLRRYPGLSLPRATIDALDGPSPHSAALDAAFAMASRALSMTGLAGVNLAAPAVADGSLLSAGDVATIGRALGGGGTLGGR